jgi:chromosome segregation ATPase
MPNDPSRTGGPEWEPSITENWKPTQVDLSHVESRHPQAFAEWTALWEQRTNFLNASKAHDSEGMTKYKAAIDKVEKQIDQFPESEQEIVTALSNRRNRQTQEAEELHSEAGRRHFNSSALHHTQFAVDEQERLARIAEAINKNKASEEEVREAQIMLRGHGYDLGQFGERQDGVDGVAGKKTRGALHVALSGQSPR